MKKDITRLENWSVMDLSTEKSQRLYVEHQKDCLITVLSLQNWIRMEVHDNSEKCNELVIWMFSLKYLPKIVTECHTECWTAQVLWTHLRLKYRSLTLNTCYSDTCISKFIWFWLINIALLPRLRIPRDVKAVACSKKPAIVFTKVMYASNSSIYIYEVIWWWHDVFTTEKWRWLSWKLFCRENLK